MTFDHAIDTRRRIADRGMSEGEWQARVELAAAYRLCAELGWTDLIYTHISARVPGPEAHFLINPFGYAFEDFTSSSLVKIDIEGRIVGDTPHTVNAAGFVIHGAVHAARHDLHCVMHLHTDAGVALSMLEEGLLPLSQHAMQFCNRIGYHAYEGLALSHAERDRLIRDLGPHKAMILRNHGLLTAGATVAEAFVLMFNLEKAARTQMQAMAASSRLVTPPPEVCELAAQQLEGDTVPVGAREWPALLRRLDRADPSYRS
jgi:ribulose-5-phosphate 4-epimerase/fuculose-1-phosphate aldolase